MANSSASVVPRLIACVIAFKSPHIAGFFTIEIHRFYGYNIHMELNTLFKAVYGKNWKDARFAEKAEAVLFGIILVQAVSALLFPKD